MIKYRPAEKEDSLKLAQLINTASDGVVEYLFQGLVPALTPVQIVARNLENDNYPHSYKSAVVACDGNDLVGMALSYPSSYHMISWENEERFYIARIILFAQPALHAA
jgi:hypothetical protein